MSEEASFAQFYADTHTQSLRFAWLIGAKAAAEDIVQDAYVAMVDRFAAIDNPHAYLRVSIVHGVRGGARRGLRERDRLARIRPRTAAPEDDMLPEIAASVARLPYKERVAIVGRYWLDLPEHEIAEMLDVRPATVRSLIKRAIGRLRLEVDE